MILFQTALSRSRLKVLAPVNLGKASLEDLAAFVPSSKSETAAAWGVAGREIVAWQLDQVSEAKEYQNSH